MKNYRVVAPKFSDALPKQLPANTPLTLPSGARVALYEDQAEARAHAVEYIDNGVFRVLEPVQFKIGEVIGLDAPECDVYRDQIEEIAE